MTDRDQMIADIEAAMTHSRPKPAVPPQPGDTVVFPVTVQFSNIFEPMPSEMIGQTRTDPRYTLTFLAHDLPVNLHPWAKPREWRKDSGSVPVISLSTKIRPVIVPTKTSKCSLDTTLDCARHNNIAGDRLLREAKIEVLVRVVEFVSHNPFNRGPTQKLNKTLDLCGIRVNVDTMVDTYDLILAELHEEFDGWRDEE